MTTLAVAGMAVTGTAGAVGAEPAETVTPVSAVAQLPSGPPLLTQPRRHGARPGRPVLISLSASGARPLRFTATGLPAGLELDSATGRISGRTDVIGTHRLEVTVMNQLGAHRDVVEVVIGPTLALTPTMGWNSWNCWGKAVDDAKVRAAAQVMADELLPHGWSYVVIDDGWQGKRDEAGVIHPNEKFPDMPGLVRFIHDHGLKAGIYSTPGTISCAGFVGSYRHEAQDAKRFAEWGFDFVKYDWCTYVAMVRDNSQTELKKPYRLMGDLLAQTDRDIVYNLCQWGLGDVWEWGAEVGGHSWRTTSSIKDTWNAGLKQSFEQGGRARFAGPGRWNDPDMLLIGVLGWGELRPTRLSVEEQVTHVTLWSLLAAPLFLGCDLTRLDDTTRALITNDEVLAVDQDVLGRQGVRVTKDGDRQVWAKPLADGTQAVGLFNLSGRAATVTVTWADLGLTGPQPVRDLWKSVDLGVLADGHSEELPLHGCQLLRVGAPRPAP